MMFLSPCLPQDSRKILLPPEFFSEQLSRHLDPALKAKKIMKKQVTGLEPSFDVLTKLEVRTDARCCPLLPAVV